MLTSLRRAGTLGEPGGANKLASPPQRRLRPIGHGAAAILAFVRRRDSLDVCKSFTPIGDRLATILHRTGFAGAESALMNDAPVFAVFSPLGEIVAESAGRGALKAGIGSAMQRFAAVQLRAVDARALR
jgi:hypothetical protein